MRSMLVLALLAAQPVAAQTAPVPTTLTVSADARVERAPDVADLSAGVLTQAATANEALRANAERMTATVAALKRAGIADRDVQTASLSLQPQYRYQDNQPPQLTGYQASNSVAIRLRRMGDIGRIVDALVAVGANQLNGPTFRIDQPDAALDQARAAAVTKARARAEVYARAAGLGVKRILSIGEGASGPPSFPVPMFARATAMKAADTPVQPGEVELTASVTVVFELG